MKKVNEDGRVIYVCECGKEFEKRKAFIGHCSRCEIHLGHKPTNNDNLGKWARDNKNKKKKAKYNNKNYTEPGNCQYCGKECKNQNSLRQHEIRCKENPNKIDTSKSWNNGNRPAWNKGLTKETDERIVKAIQTRKDNIKSGKVKVSHRKHTEEEKKKISEARKKYLKEHPDKVPYLLNHSSKISYPEQYFIDLFKKESINLKYHKQVGLYQLDFYNEDLMKYVEVDGQTHDLEKVKEIDKRRTEFLSNKGWEGLRINWSHYQSLNQEGKKDIIQQIKIFLEKEN